MSSPAPRHSNDYAFPSPTATPLPSQSLFSPTSPFNAQIADKSYFARRGSTASSKSFNVTSSTSREGSIAEANSNAISTLLQPPIVRTGLNPHTAGSSSYKPPSSRDIPPVTLTNIRHVEPTAFDAYLRQAGSLYEAFQQAKDVAADGPSRLQGSKSESNATDPNRLLQNRKSSAPNTPILEHIQVAPQSPSERPRRSSRRRGPPTIAPLSTVPNVYFDSDFHLQNPRTFDIVSERSEIVTPSSNGPIPQGGRRTLATNAILQEKLSWYMDTVEVHLISSISTASASFFAALGSLRELHTEAAASVAKIKALREELGSLDKNMAQGGLKIVTLRRRRENVRRLGNAVKQLREIAEEMGKCEEQVDKDDIEDALEGLTVVESLINGRRRTRKAGLSSDSAEGLCNLQNAKALQGAGEDIAILRQKIGRIFEQRLLESLLGDLRNHLESVPPEVTFERWDRASSRSRGVQSRTPSTHPAYLQIGDKLRSTLQKHLEGLANADCLRQATTAYRDALLREIKALIRKQLPSSTDDDMESTMSASTQGGRRSTRQEKSSVLARNLRDLDPEDAESMLRKIYANVGEALRRLSTQVKVVLDITSSFSSGSSAIAMNGAPRDSRRAPSVKQEDIQQTLDMSNLLGQGVDIAQAQITKILKVRSDQTARLHLPLFLRYFTLNRLFADECEAVSGRSGVAFKTVVNTHIKDFVHLAGNLERQTLLEGMDTDRWEAKDFAESDAQALQEIIMASTQEVPSWSKDLQIWTPQESAQLNGILANGKSEGIKDKTRSASIDEQKFILPDSALLVLRGTRNFERIMSGMPSMTQDVVMSLLEYLKLFNSRSSQLILGAGATRSAGLNNITTKHLALASQALSFVIALIPYIRESVRRYQTNPQGLMIEFDKVKRLFLEHQSGINDKLVDIMSNRAAMHVNSMKQISWDSPAGDGVSAYMETLIKETTTLQKVLSKHLPAPTVQQIMDPIFNSYRKQWVKAFREAAVTTDEGKQRLLRDAEYFNTRISKIDGSGSLGDAVLQFAKEKSKEEANGQREALFDSAEGAKDGGPEVGEEESAGQKD